MDTKNDLLISKMERARERLNSVLDQVAPQAELYPTWKLKQVYDHIAGWDELVVATLHSFLQGESQPPAVIHGISRFNAASVKAHQGLSVDQSRQSYASARQQVLELLRQVPPEKLAQKFTAPWGGLCSVNGIVKIFCSHEQEHATQIEEALKSSTARS